MIETQAPRLLAWCPEGILSPNRVLYAMVPPGEVTMDIWLDCLANRIQMMLDRKKWFKRRLANKVCKILEWPPCEDLENFGRYIIEYKNGRFKRVITGSILKGKKPFPAMVTEQDDEVYEDIQVTSLEGWAGLASLVTGGILLSDRIHRHIERPINKQYFASKNKSRSI